MSTKIEWTEETWNPVTGCNRISPGCDHCYALTMAKRLKGMGQEKYQKDGDSRTSGPGFGVSLHPKSLEEPLHWHKPRRVFVNSMSDLFHNDITDEFIAEVFAVMALAPQHTFQVLTKRSQRMAALLADHGFWALVGIAGLDRDCWLPDVGVTLDRHALHNVWLGTSVENQRYADLRIPHLLKTPAAVRFLSMEPLLGPVSLRDWISADCARCDNSGSVPVDGGGMACPDCYSERFGSGRGVNLGIDWVIVGGESGPGARPMHPAWARDIRDQCWDAGVPFFFKQAGAVLAKEWGCSDRSGTQLEELPKDLQVREFPA